ncbi:MAG: hypothetical protein QXU98_05050 [Candidatus Parvarchaeota archaeon]
MSATQSSEVCIFNRITGQSQTQLTIPNRVNYRNKLIDLFVTGPPSGGYADIYVGSRVYMRYPFQVASSTLIQSPTTKIAGLGGFGFFIKNILKDESLFPNAAEDEEIVINLSAAAAEIDAYYLQCQGGDVTSHNVAGGSDYPTKPFIDIFTYTATAVGAGQQITNEVVPTGLALLDSNRRISPTKQFTLYSLVADYVSGGTNYTTYNRLHVYDEENELFTPLDHSGLEINLVTNTNDINYNFSSNTYFTVNPPYVFNPNHLVTLLTDVSSVTGTGSTIYVYLMGIKKNVGGGGG